jgi:hypothetical protein
MHTRVYVEDRHTLRAVLRDPKTGTVRKVAATTDKEQFRADVRKALTELVAARAVSQGA